MSFFQKKIKTLVGNVSESRDITKQNVFNTPIQKIEDIYSKGNFFFSFLKGNRILYVEQ